MNVKTLTFSDLVKIEPGLGKLLNDAKHYRLNRGECHITVWYKVFKPQLLKLVGWFAMNPYPTLKGRLAYDIAYKTVFDALPGCPRGCNRCN
jgi:hypothetical protein